MTQGEAAALAAEYVRIHNAAAREFKADFAAVGARLWHGDYAHALKSKNRDFIAGEMKRMGAAAVRKVYGHAVQCPLTVLDSYPDVKPRDRRRLREEVLRLTDEYNARWHAYLTERGL